MAVGADEHHAGGGGRIQLPCQAEGRIPAAVRRRRHQPSYLVAAQLREELPAVVEIGQPIVIEIAPLRLAPQVRGPFLKEGPGVGAELLAVTEVDIGDLTLHLAEVRVERKHPGEVLPRFIAEVDASGTQEVTDFPLFIRHLMTYQDIGHEGPGLFLAGRPRLQLRQAQMPHLLGLVLPGQVCPPTPLVCPVMIADKINTEDLVCTLQVQDAEGDSDFSRPAICGVGRGCLPVPFPGNLTGTATGDGGLEIWVPVKE